MAQRKKLQVFVSSTYADLREERQSAVEAILTAGHIPAGMELFAAGDKSQMNTIRLWIDESDVYLLILGGRYGSIDPETQKSYIHLEYEYALEKGKPLFAVAIAEDHLEERVRKLGLMAIEREQPQKLQEFRALVLSRIVRFWRDPRDIKLAILETMSEFSRRAELVGWVPGSEAANVGVLAEEIARLVKENAVLREQVQKLSSKEEDFNGLTFEELYSALASFKISTEHMSAPNIKSMNEVAELFGDPEPALLHAFWMLSGALKKQAEYLDDDPINGVLMSKLQDFVLVEYDAAASRAASPGTLKYNVFELTDVGRRFLLHLRLKRDTSRLESYILT
jgi:hypothetical protein